MKIEARIVGAIEDLKSRLDWLEGRLKAGQSAPYAAASVQSSLKRLQHWLAEYDSTQD
jgi:hypothetical protein